MKRYSVRIRNNHGSVAEKVVAVGAIVERDLFLPGASCVITVFALLLLHNYSFKIVVTTSFNSTLY